MEQTSWNIKVFTNSGLVNSDLGSLEVDASTIVPVTIPATDTVVLALQLADTSKINVFNITCDKYDATVEVTSDVGTYKLTGPVLLCGETVSCFSANLSTLSIENKSSDTDAEVTILIGRDLS